MCYVEELDDGSATEGYVACYHMLFYITSVSTTDVKNTNTKYLLLLNITILVWGDQHVGVDRSSTYGRM